MKMSGAMRCLVALRVAHTASVPASIDVCVAGGSCGGEEAEMKVEMLQRQHALSKRNLVTERSVIKDNNANSADTATCSDLDSMSCAADVRWAFEYGKDASWAEEAYGSMSGITGSDYRSATLEDFHRFFACGGVPGKECESPPCSCSNPPCDACAAASRDDSGDDSGGNVGSGDDSGGNVGSGSNCADLGSLSCAGDVHWAFDQGRNMPWAQEAYGGMAEVTGQDFHSATLEDFQRYFACGRVPTSSCDAPPCSCSNPPCDTCPGGPSRFGPREPYATCADAVSGLNVMYRGYDENNAESPSGITISWINTPGSQQPWLSNLFCAPVLGTQCFQGRSDCALSSLIINHKIMIDTEKHAPLSYSGYPVGYILDQEAVETHIGKCVYAFDGASNNRYNRKCGNGASNDCNNPRAAFYNVCGQDMHTCRREDREVNAVMCSCDEDWCSSDPSQYGNFNPPNERASGQCFWEMPALIADDVTTTNHLRDMLRHRLGRQEANNWDAEFCRENNELVIDVELMLAAIADDPARVIRAFVYVDGYKERAETMRDGFHDHFNMGDRPRIPVIKLDHEQDFRSSGGPFHCE